MVYVGGDGAWACSFCKENNLAGEMACKLCGLSKSVNAVVITSPLDTQVGGGHYKDLAIQPVEFIHKNGIGYMEGNAIKYLTRWRSKGGIEDLKKARHYIDLLLEMEAANASAPR